MTTTDPYAVDSTTRHGRRGIGRHTPECPDSEFRDPRSVENPRDAAPIGFRHQTESSRVVGAAVTGSADVRIDVCADADSDGIERYITLGAQIHLLTPGAARRVAEELLAAADDLEGGRDLGVPAAVAALRACREHLLRAVLDAAAATPLLTGTRATRARELVSMLDAAITQCDRLGVVALGDARAEVSR